jgi:hypothetical protein
MHGARAAVAIIVGLLPVAGAQAAEKIPVEIVGATAQCTTLGRNENYSIEFSVGMASLTTTAKSDGKDIRIKDKIGAVVQLGGTAIVVVPPNSGNEVTSVYFFGATTKAAYYLMGGVLEHEDKCKLISSET